MKKKTAMVVILAPDDAIYYPETNESYPAVFIRTWYVHFMDDQKEIITTVLKTKHDYHAFLSWNIPFWESDDDPEEEVEEAADQYHEDVDRQIVAQMEALYKDRTFYDMQEYGIEETEETRELTQRLEAKAKEAKEAEREALNGAPLKRKGVAVTPAGHDEVYYPETGESYPAMLIRTWHVHLIDENKEIIVDVMQTEHSYRAFLYWNTAFWATEADDEPAELIQLFAASYSKSVYQQIFAQLEARYKGCTFFNAYGENDNIEERLRTKANAKSEIPPPDETKIARRKKKKERIKKELREFKSGGGAQAATLLSKVDVGEWFDAVDNLVDSGGAAVVVPEKRRAAEALFYKILDFVKQYNPSVYIRDIENDWTGRETAAQIAILHSIEIRDTKTFGNLLELTHGFDITSGVKDVVFIGTGVDDTMKYVYNDGKYNPELQGKYEWDVWCDYSAGGTKYSPVPGEPYPVRGEKSDMFPDGFQPWQWREIKVAELLAGDGFLSMDFPKERKKK
ncbi:MAG: hypothetical protein LBS10_01390 [Gracilibacteraceae bacterium]|nr:hypothetical protein [Gracilibacteraceae bacterium]